VSETRPAGSQLLELIRLLYSSVASIHRSRKGQPELLHLGVLVGKGQVVDTWKVSRVLLAEVRDLTREELAARVLGGGRPASLQEVQDDSSGEVVVNRHGFLQHNKLAQDDRHKLRDVFCQGSSRG
jgi:hypothetical protein